MRKKIFIIHGLGEKDGLGKESGGDLDTVSSNAFFGAWFQHHFKEKTGREPVYGEDYEFDFVNYSEGLRHLDWHPGSDLYLPDFPIDALAPRLELRRMQRAEEAGLRSDLYQQKQIIRRIFYGNSECFSETTKTIYNDLVKQIGKITADRKYYEIWMTRQYSSIIGALAGQIVETGEESEVIKLLADWLTGREFDRARSELKDVLDSNLKRELLFEIPQGKVNRRLLLNDSIGFDYGCRGRLGWHEQMLGVWVEGVSVYVSTCLMLNNIADELTEEAKKDFKDWLGLVRDAVLGPLEQFHKLVEKILQANQENQNIKTISEDLKTVKDFWNQLSYEWLIADSEALKNRLIVQLVESTSGRPVEGVELVFNVKQGELKLSRPESQENSYKNLALPTDEAGTAEVLLEFATEDKSEFGVTVTHNDLDFITYPEDLILTEDYFSEHPAPDSVEFRLVEYIRGGSSGEEKNVNVEQLESGKSVATDRALEINCDLIEAHIRHLAEHDVRLMRIDDHHPYAPEILQRLEKLKEEGLIVEDIVLSSLPQGQELPLEEQKCGGDLIYEQFVKDTQADNPGLQRLRAEARLQDLHIKESKLAIELSKLIGSSYNKVKMVKALMSVKTKREFTSIMSRQCWDEVVAQYEAGLARVLPRVEKSLFHIKLVEPPEEGAYSDKVGLGKFFHPIELLTGGPGSKEHFYRDFYAKKSGRGVDIFAALSPFCNKRLGEPSINIASALNYLKKRYSMDYYFYAYGSFLFSTRRVNESGYDIDLSNLVSKIGSPSDGGHASAATGSPENNPGFPKKRFDRVSDRNFAEYLYYLLETITEETGLDLVALEEQYPEEFEPGMEKVLSRLERNVYRLQLTGEKSGVNICMAKSVYTGKDDPNLTYPLALAHLRSKYPMDYFFYSLSPSNLVMRNIRDHEETVDLSKVARLLGTYRDGGNIRAASCQPMFNAKFDRASFQRVTNSNFGNYVKFIGKRLMEELDFKQYQVKSY